jgi:hypothetical protein
VLQTFTMSLSNEKIHGKSIPGYVTIMSTDSSITLVMTEETAAAEYPPHELVSLLARTCGIQEQHHVTLLLIALGKSSLRSINAAFLQQGIRVDGLSLSMFPYYLRARPSQAIYYTKDLTRSSRQL